MEQPSQEMRKAIAKTFATASANGDSVTLAIRFGEHRRSRRKQRQENPPARTADGDNQSIRLTIDKVPRTNRFTETGHTPEWSFATVGVDCWT